MEGLGRVLILKMVIKMR